MKNPAIRKMIVTRIRKLVCVVAMDARALETVRVMPSDWQSHAKSPAQPTMIMMLPDCTADTLKRGGSTGRIMLR